MASCDLFDYKQDSLYKAFKIKPNIYKRVFEVGADSFLADRLPEVKPIMYPPKPKNNKIKNIFQKAAVWIISNIWLFTLYVAAAVVAAWIIIKLKIH